MSEIRDPEDLDPDAVVAAAEAYHQCIRPDESWERTSAPYRGHMIFYVREIVWAYLCAHASPEEGR